MKRYVIFLLCMSVVLFASAQIKVTGRVSNLSGKPIPDVIVKCTIDGRTLAYTTTNAQGTYTLQLKEMPSKETIVQYRHISYEVEEMKMLIKEKTVKQDMVLTDKAISLKEVTVKAPPLLLLGDTLSYNLASFLGKGDVTLEDGLKRLPGISVSDNGAIRYMGKDISKFYIEGMDMLGGKYNLATKNIPAQYATQVEVMKHHKARKIDADEESDAVAINVKLSNKAKFKPFGQPVLGIGLREDELLGAVGVTGMMFTDNFQLLGSAKWSNHGNFGAYDMIDHYGNSSVSTLATGKLGRWSGGRPPIGEYLYEDNAFLTLNGIQRVDSNRQVRVNADYVYESNHNSYSNHTLYFADGQHISVSETSRPSTRVHRPMIEMKYENNGKDRYFSETLRLKAQWEDSECPMFSDVLNQQRRDATAFNAVNSMWSTVRMGKHKFSLQSDITFDRAPKVLLLMNDISQSGQSTSLKTYHCTSFNIKLNDKWRLGLPVYLQADYNFLETSLIKPVPLTGSQPDESADRQAASSSPGMVWHHDRGALSGWNIMPYAAPGTEWRSADNKTCLSMRVNLSWRNMMYDSRYDDKHTTFSSFFVDPRINFRYTFSGTSEMQLYTGISHSAGDMLDLFTTPVQLNYRSTSAASGVIGKSQSWTTTFSYKYQIPFKYFTFTADAGWTQGKRNVLNAQVVDEHSTESTTIFRDSHSRNANAGVSMSKNLLAICTKLQFNANANWGSGESMSQGKLLTTYATSYSLSGKAVVSPQSWMEVSASANYSRHFTRWQGNHSAVDDSGARGSLSLFPIDKLEIKGSFDYIHSQITDHQYKDFSLLSASLQYKAKRAVWKLSLNNLLDTRHYAYTTYSGPDRFTFDCNLVGRTIMLGCKLHLLKEKK